MKTYNSLSSIQTGAKAYALTIGNFDGLHLGHRALLDKLKSVAEQRQLQSMVVSFEPHPVKVLHPEADYKRLFPIEDLKIQLEEFGIDALVMQPFTKSFSDLSAEEFFKNKLIDAIHPEYILFGHDFHFGKNREGDADLAKKICSGCQVDVFGAKLFNGERVSTSLIKESVLVGDLEKAKQLLGRAYVLYGEVVQGDQRGREIGFPTANIKYINELIPQNGVYCCELKIGEKTFYSVANIGRRPSFKPDDPVIVEAHILNFSEDIYGRSVRLLVHKKLRDEQKFSSADELKVQIEKDVQNCRSYFGVHQ